MNVTELIFHLSRVPRLAKVMISCEGGCVIGDITDIFLGKDLAVYIGDSPPMNADIAIYENDGKPSYRKEKFPGLGDGK